MQMTHVAKVSLPDGRVSYFVFEFLPLYDCTWLPFGSGFIAIRRFLHQTLD